ncbi:MAG: single-stranded DNA-binding protein [Deltaproteobacteria bacterium]|nr:single-stranded DNA-binding protein [Deltaproteobacteria bacterium]
MSSFNRVILIGNLGHQPELKYTTSNRPVCELRIAVNRVWNDRNGQRQEKTDWFSVEVWDKTAEFCERYLTKGRAILVEGRLSNDEWTDKEGQKRTKTKVVADRVQFVGNRGDGDGGYSRGGSGAGGDRGPAPRTSDGGPPPPADDYHPPEDDIPF